MSLACMLLLVVASTCLYIWMFVGATLLPRCPDRCKCDEKQMRCEGFIPRTVPNNVSEILLSFNSTRLLPGMFCNVSWENIIRLSIDYTSPMPDLIHLDAYVFLCLEKIQVLKVYTENRFNTTKNSLYGLESVTVLDLSGCKRLKTQELVTLMSVKGSIANLKKLILSGSGYVNGLNVSQDLIEALTDKNITEIDLSNTQVSFDVQNLSGICDTLETINLSNSHVNYIRFDKHRLCKSWSVLDLNGAIFPVTSFIMNPKCVNDHIMLMKLNYLSFKHLNILYLSRLIPASQTVYFINCTLTVVGDSYNLTELQFNGYNIPTFDLELVNALDRLQNFELSSNRIQSIGPNVFKAFKHLIRLDLSKNNLSQSKLFDETFSVLFQNNSNLIEISLSDNGIGHLPTAIFSSNTYLKRIDISKNRLQQITFDISRLTNLEILDMRNNSVQYLDKVSRAALDSLYEMQHLVNHTLPNTTSAFLIDLRANPFSCACDSLLFIKWFILSPIFNNRRHLYHCKLDGREIEMNYKAVAAAEDDCERPERKMKKLLLSSITPTTVTAILVLIIVYVVKRYRKKKFYQKLEDQVGLLHDDNIEFRFPVFVSYSSDDIAFVIPNVINPLRENLQRIAGTDRELVCVGDRYFRLGRSIFSEIITCLQNCAVVVVVMSTNYCKSDYCKLEIEQSRLMRKPIIIIVKEEVDEEDMNAVTKEIFRHFTRIGFIIEDGQIRLQRDWEDLCLSIIQLL